MQLLYCTQKYTSLFLNYSLAIPKEIVALVQLKKNVVQKSCNKETSLTESSSDVTE